MEETTPIPSKPDRDAHLKLLQQYRHIAIVGLSANQSRPSHSVASYMQREGYDIIPINPRYAGETILGKRVYASLTEAKAAGKVIEIVDIFRRAEAVLPIVEEASQIGAKVVWLQLGIKNAEAEKKAQERELIFVQDKCIKIERTHLKEFKARYVV
jgi:predicted CoA-binding protein